METVESKPKVGVCLLSCYGVFDAFLKDEDVVEAQALEYLDLVAESMGLDKMLIAVVSNESLSMKYASEAREKLIKVKFSYVYFTSFIILYTISIPLI